MATSSGEITPSSSPAVFPSTTVHHSVPFKLSSTNYNVWRAQFEPLFRAYDLMGLVDGSSPPPPREITTSDGSTILNDEFLVWYRKDQIVLSWLVSSVTEEIAHQVSDLKSSHEVWTRLEKFYARQAQAQIYHYESELSSLEKGDMSITDYVNKARVISLNLAASGKPIDDDDLAHAVLHGLGSEYESAVTSLTSRVEPVTFDELVGFLLTHEQRLLTFQPKIDVAGRRGWSSCGGRGGRGYKPNMGIQCQICGGFNHIAVTCYYRYDDPPSNGSPQVNLTEIVPDTAPQLWNPDSGTTHHVTNKMPNLDEFRFALPVKKRGERRLDMGQPKGREWKRVSFESTEEGDDDEFGLASIFACGGGRRLAIGQRKGLDWEGVSFELTGEDENDEFDDELGVEDGLLSEGEGGGESVEKGVIGSSSSYQGEATGESLEWKKRSLGGESDSFLSNSRFVEFPLSPLSLKGVKAAGYERMTVVQEATLPVILRGKDVLARAKTGTGKTVAFLLPAIEIAAQQPRIDCDQQRPPIYVLVICPTRELANQAAMEADKLLKFHPNIGTQCVTGGIKLALEQQRMQANPCQILVATPGRLRDHIENTAGFATRLRGVKVLVLDEADHLLDMGFRKDIEQIIAAVPKQRQTLLFSATIPEEVRQICHIALRSDHEYINIVEEGREETHSQVRQNFLIVPLERQFSVLYHLLTDHIADDVHYKVLLFCTTAKVTRLVANFLSEMKLNVREIHSRKTQSYRSKVSEEFRESKGLVLVTSDVSARGMDYPDVTLVIQLGVPSDRKQYIHRLGRTGRKGKEGQGILILAPWEEYFLSNIRDLPIAKVPLCSVDPGTTRKVQHALAHVPLKNKESAYQAWLGYYNSNKTIGRDKSRLVELANEFSRSMGLENPPAIPKRTLGKIGLRNVPGLHSK